MQEDQVPDNISDKSKVPTFLMVLLVLSGLNVSYGLFKLLTSLGDLPPDDLIEQVEVAMDNADVDLDELPVWLIPDVMDFMENFIQNFGLINAVDLAYYLILLPALFLMFRLKILGYYIYVATQVAGVLCIPFLYGTNVISWIFLAWFAFTAILFIVLYTVNKKHLH